MKAAAIPLMVTLFLLVAAFIPQVSAGSTYYFPSSYSLQGYTRYISGLLSDLQSDNAAYMTFRSYVSATSSTAKSDAVCGYRSNTGTATLSSPKIRTWDGTSVSWSSEAEQSTAGSPVRRVKVAYCPLAAYSQLFIMVTLSDDGYLDAYVYDGRSWTVTNNIASVGTTVNAYSCFDIAFERTSGEALLVYSTGQATNEIGWRTWSISSGWSSPSTMENAYTTGVVNILFLAECPATRAGSADDDEIAMIYIDANVDVFGYIWTGTAWSAMGQTAVWDATAAIATEECIAVAYEQTTGRAMFIWGDATATDNYYRIWDGSTLTSATLLDIPAQGGLTNWVTLKSAPNSAALAFVAVDAGSDLNTAYWSGSAWTVHTEHDAAVDTHAARCADVAWESDGSDILLVWGTTAGSISWRKITPPNTLGTISTPAWAGTHPWVQLRTNPRSVSGDVMIMGASLNSNFDIGAFRWDGTTFTIIGEATFTADTTVSTYECWDMEFAYHVPSQYTVQIEFSGSSDLGSWTSLTWTIDSSFSDASCTAVFQLYNYQAGSYPTSGDGYMSATIGTTDVTQSQTINSNPTRFRDASGNWKMMLTGTLSGKTCIDWLLDLVRFTAAIFTAYERAASDQLPLSSSTQRVYGITRAKGDFLLLSSSTQKSSGILKSITDFLPLTSSVQRFFGVSKSFTDFLPLSSSVQRFSGVLRYIGDLLPLSSAVQKVTGLSRSLFDLLPLSDAVSKAASWFLNFEDFLGLFDSVVYAHGFQFFFSLADLFSLSDIARYELGIRQVISTGALTLVGISLGLILGIVAVRLVAVRKRRYDEEGQVEFFG